ncbi:MAG TPA: outer membrane beta-barrel protein [Verrucomicrobiae bacterium]
MKSNYKLAITMAAGVILAAGTSLRAADTDSTTTTTTSSSTVATPPPDTDRGLTNNLEPIYQSNELSIDGFGMGSVGNYTLVHPSNDRIKNNSQGGVGVGLNYFFTRFVGIGAEAYSQNTTGVFIDNASANLLLRMPLGESGFAPYVLGGGGHQFDAAKLWFGQAGAGMEYRFCHNIGMFVDARCVWPNETKYYGVGRVGIRLTF